MKKEDFDEVRFTGGMRAMHNGKKKFVMSVDFPEGLFGLTDKLPGDDFDPWEMQWARCENVELTTK